MSAPALLIADDQPDVVEALRLLFKRDGYAVVSTNSPAGVIGALEAQEFDAALIDLNYARDTTSGREGLDLLGRIRTHWPNLPVVVMTAWGSVESAVEAIASQLHALSPRATRPLVPVNAGALSEGIFESELFGHVKGAFTDAKSDRTGCFELASESTLFLDEVGNMPLSQQAKLLRVLQTGEFHPVGSSRVRKTNARVISATNADLRAAVQKGTFREDLLYRLNTVELLLPALRDRRDDIVPLASAFLERQARKYRREGIRFSNEALRALLDYSWPRKVRELEHAVDRATLLAGGEEVTAAVLALRSASESARHFEQMTLEEAERYLIQRALGKCDGNVSEAAKLLGVSRSALYRRLEAYGLKES